MANEPAIADVLTDGYAVAPSVVDAAGVQRCIDALLPHPQAGRATGYNQRNILSIPSIAALANGAALRSIVESILGAGAHPVRGILFDKVAGANWFVGWHQDCAVAVKKRPANPGAGLSGYGPWSVKAGVVHVEPPVEVLERMLTLRVHLDDCDETNGPLRVIPGSHAHGKLSEGEIKRWVAERAAVTCCAAAGDVVVMRPLLLHASTRAAAAAGGKERHRRVVHIEYAAGELAGGLRWAERGEAAAAEASNASPSGHVSSC